MISSQIQLAIEMLAAIIITMGLLIASLAGEEPLFGAVTEEQRINCIIWLAPLMFLAIYTTSMMFHLYLKI